MIFSRERFRCGTMLLGLLCLQASGTLATAQSLTANPPRREGLQKPANMARRGSGSALTNQSDGGTPRFAAASGTSVPLAAQPAISATLGRDDLRYQVHSVQGGFRTENPKQALAAEFTTQGVEVRSGAAQWRLSLYGYGYGDTLTAVRTVAPQANANRVEYPRGALTEWYVNGPAGLEQGFTLPERPGQNSGEPLTIALMLSNDVTASIDPGGAGLTLTHADGRAALRYSGLLAYDSKGKELPAHLELREGQLLVRVADADAKYPLVVDPFVQLAELTASDGANGDNFGGGIAISPDGGTVFVGAFEATRPFGLQGLVYIFVKPAGGWAGMTETARLTPSDAAAGDFFGATIAASGDGSTLVVGACHDMRFGSTTPGAAYVFLKPAGGWAGTLNEAAKLTASDAQGSSVFGFDLCVAAMSNDAGTVLVGAPTAKVGSNDLQGAAYVFLKPTGGWAGNLTETAKLTSSDGAAGDEFGDGAATNSDGSILVVGASEATVGSNSRQGAAYVFLKPTGGWAGNLTETAKLTSSDGTASDEFGESSTVMTSDGGTLFVGAPGQNSGQGAAYVFLKPTGGWATTSTFAAKLTASDGAANSFFGRVVAINDNAGTALIGAFGATVNSNSGQGAAYVFQKPAGGWAGNLNETTKLTSSDGTANDNFGTAVAISSGGNTLAVGASSFPSNLRKGAAYVFGQPPPCVAPPSGMVAWWPGDGNANDIVGGNNGTTQGGVTFTAGEVGQAFNFDGSTGYVQVPQNSLWEFGGNDFTVDFWVNFRSPNTSACLDCDNVFDMIGVDEGAGPFNKWVVRFGGGKLALLTNSNGSYEAVAPFSPNLNQWYFLAVTRTGNTFTTYINGQAAGTSMVALTINYINAPLTWGLVEAGRYLNGLMDEVEIYNRGLSAAEIQSIYSAGSTGKCKQAATSLSVASVSASYGGTADLQATLTRASDNSPLSGETISFTLNNNAVVGTPTTNTSGVATITGASLVGISAGTYPTGVGASFAGDANFAASNGTAQLTISRAPATVALSNLNYNYDGTAKSATVTTNPPSLTASVTYNNSAVLPMNAGSYNVAATVTDPNYQGSTTGTLTINKVPLTITANNVLRPYGSPNPLLGASYSGFVNGEGPGALTGTPSCVTTAISGNGAGSPGSLPGNYPITCSGQTSNNYTITYVAGTLTVVSAPLAALSTTSLTFPVQRVGTTSPAQNVTLTNSGTAGLAISGIAPTGDFSETNGCPASLGIGISCTIHVRFMPTTTGTRTGSVVITDGAADSPQTVSLTGTGGVATISLTSNSLTFSDQLLATASAAQTVMLSNAGTVPLTGLSIVASGDFSRTSTCGGTVAAGASCNINVRFRPTATGLRSGSVAITGIASNSPQSIALSGNGINPVVSLSSGSLAFGKQLLGAVSVKHTVTLMNSGTTPLAIATIAPSGDFAETDNCPLAPATLAPTLSCAIDVTFKPTATGSRTGKITITDNAGGSPQHVNLSGTGINPAVTLSVTSLIFGPQTVGTTSAAKSVTLTNSGTTTLTISSILASGDFSRTQTCGGSVVAGASCTISVRFKPTATGTRTGAITITDDAGDSPQVISLSGTGQ